jgi:hypothetical protein
MAIQKYSVQRSLVGLLLLSALVIALSAHTGAAAPPTTNTLIVNPPSSPVPTQNVGGGAATQVGQPVSKIVNLTCFDAPPFGCFQLGVGVFTVPVGEALVITDVQFKFQSTAGAGNYGIVSLSDSVTGNELIPLMGLTDANSNVAGQIHLGAGAVVQPGSRISILPFGTKDFAFVQGYLVPNQ